MLFFKFKMGIFKISADDLHWLEGSDEREDLCLHGHAVAIIGNETLEYDCAVSATALYLLKTLTENHEIDKDNQILPCCGFSIIADESLSNVTIIGCPNGIDWSVFHEEDNIKIILRNGHEEIIPLNDYKKEVFEFADIIENFYQTSLPKILPKNEYDRNGYLTFWKEWHRRRKES